MRNERFDLGEGIARQELTVIFVIDNSGSMEGEKIGAVNNAIRDVMSIMPDIQDDTGDATIKISAMTFSDDAKWIYSEPKTIEEFKWRDIGTESATNLSAACDELSRFLCKRENGGKLPAWEEMEKVAIKRAQEKCAELADYKRVRKVVCAKEPLVRTSIGKVKRVAYKGALDEDGK